MYKKICFDEFVGAFEDARRNNFSRDGLKAIYDYIVELETETGEFAGLDVVSICGEFMESTIDDFLKEHDIEADNLDDAEKWEAVISYIADHSPMVEKTAAGTVVYMAF